MGIGQGNRAGPQIWAAICTPLFDIMQLDSFITNICCAMSGQDLQLAGFAFMDDTYFCIAGQSSVGATIVDLMQQSVTQWEGLLTATGGALVPEKCFWYLLEFKQSNRQWKYSAKTCMQASIQIRDTNNQSWTINRLELHEARWTLGVCLAPDGNCQAKLEYLKSIAQEWTTKMVHAKLVHNDAAFSLKNVLLCKLVYPLMVTSFTEKEYHTILQPILDTGLP